MKRDYEDPVYKDLRKIVLKRDKHRCKYPGCRRRKPLEVHHIMPWSQATTLRYDPQNCITLCKEHHKECTGNEQIYQSLFYQIIDNANNT